MKRRQRESLSERRLLRGMGQSSPRISCWSPLSLCPSSSVAPFLCSPSLCSSESSSPLPVFFHSSWWDVRWDVCIFLPFGSRKMKKKKNANSANKSRFLCIWYPKTASYYIIQQIKMTKASKSSLYSVYHKIRSSICRRRFGIHEVRVCE